MKKLERSIIKYIILACILYSLQSIVYGQNLNLPDSQKTKIYIIGVVHFENQFRNSDSLLKMLIDIRPDLILSETDTLSGYFKSDSTLVEPPKWYKIARKLNAGRKMPPEMEVLYRYREINNSLSIYPFDMVIRNRKQYDANQSENENKWVSSLNYASSNNMIPVWALQPHKEFINYNNWFFEISQSSYIYMNRTVITDSIRQMMKLENEYFPRVIDSVQILSGYKQWNNQNTNDWFIRNDIMTKNIIKYIERFKPKKVVVFTGLLHKYILTDLLNYYNNQQNYKLVEYFENKHT
jgi:hypothetical protein